MANPMIDALMQRMAPTRTPPAVGSKAPPQQPALPGATPVATAPVRDLRGLLPPGAATGTIGGYRGVPPRSSAMTPAPMRKTTPEGSA